MGVWVVTGRDRVAEQLVFEAALPSVTLAELRATLDRPDDPLLGVTALPAALAPLITRDLPHADPDFDRVAYSIRECSTGPEPEWRDGEQLPPRHAAAASGQPARDVDG